MVKLYATQIVDVDGYAYPPSAGRDLVEAVVVEVEEAVEVARVEDKVPAAAGARVAAVASGSLASTGRSPRYNSRRVVNARMVARPT